MELNTDRAYAFSAQRQTHQVPNERIRVYGRSQPEVKHSTLMPCRSEPAWRGELDIWFIHASARSQLRPLTRWLEASAPKHYYTNPE